MCYCPWFKHFNEHLAGSKVAAWIGPKEGHRGAALLEHFHKHLVFVVLQLQVRA
jgi:hypothetical protein